MNRSILDIDKIAHYVLFLVQKIVQEDKMEDWRDSLTFPMPKIYVPDEDFIGKKVTLNRCEFHEHLDPAAGYKRKDVSLTGNCNCKLKSKTVTITGMNETSRARFYRSTCYTVAESKNLVHEFEFSAEVEKPGIIFGYIIEGEPNHFISAGWNYVEKGKVEEGYIHNTGVTKDLLKLQWKEGYAPIRAYPAEYDVNAHTTKVIGEPVAWDKLKEKILIK